MSDTTSSSPKGAKPVRKPNVIVKGYLVLYNLASMVLWGGVLATCILHLFVQQQPYTTLYERVNELLTLTQTLAVLEILHSLIGIVSSPVVTVAIQVASRLLLVWGITNPVPSSRVHWGYAMMVLSWSAVEIPRYAFYAVNLLVGSEGMPYVLTYLRYSLFMVLYPSGISGELSCIWQSLEAIRSTRMWTYAMPNAWNFSFNWYTACLVILAMYVPGSPFMYGHMLAQRKKVLGGGAKDPKKKA